MSGDVLEKLAGSRRLKVDSGKQKLNRGGMTRCYLDNWIGQPVGTRRVLV
jgi:hypothetical protein